MGSGRPRVRRPAAEGLPFCLRPVVCGFAGGASPRSKEVGGRRGAFGGCAHARQPGPCPDRERSRLPQVPAPRATRPLPSPGVPERLCGPDEGRLAGGECDPPSVRKPSLAIREACLGVPDPPACRLSLRCGSAAVATRLQRAPLPRCSPLEGMRPGEKVRVPPDPAVGAERAARRLLWPAPPPSVLGEDPAGPGPTFLADWERLPRAAGARGTPSGAGRRCEPALRPLPCRAATGAGDRVRVARGWAAWLLGSEPSPRGGAPVSRSGTGSGTDERRAICGPWCWASG